ncbi:MAG: hypothetical protein ACJ8BW_13690 [Ktedonobacteraceae bacterium]|jgi:hypothetical protein
MRKATLELNEDEAVFIYDALQLQISQLEDKQQVNQESTSDYRDDCCRVLMLRIREQWEEQEG